MDHWMSTLFPVENKTIDDFARLSARLREAMGPHVIGILRHGLSVVLDFPANTVKWRNWMRSLINEADVAHELHVLDVADRVCKQRLSKTKFERPAPVRSERGNIRLVHELFRPAGTRGGLQYRHSHF